MNRSVLGVGASAVSVGALLCSCGGPPAAHRDLLAETAIAKDRCELGKTNSRPFLVDWEASDIQLFQASSHDNVAIVNFSGCKLTLLSDCVDPSVRGRYGAYLPPLWTSGSMESLLIRSEGELFSQLPLGGAFADTVRAGQGLELKYFVRGSKASSRAEIFRGELAGNPKCEGATHFVSMVQMGAFRLFRKDARESTNIEASKKLQESGSLTECEEKGAPELTRCTAPIRLVLKPITEGEKPADSAPPLPSANKAAEATFEEMHVLTELLKSAEKKLAVGDAKGCLEDLDRFAARSSEKGKDAVARWRCEMAAGRCEDGRKRALAYYAETSPGTSADSRKIVVRDDAIKYCGPNDGDFVERMMRLRGRAGAAAAGGAAGACTAVGRAIENLAKLAATENDKAELKNDGSSSLSDVSRCLFEAGACAEGVHFSRLGETNFGTRPLHDPDGPVATARRFPKCKTFSEPKK